MGPQKLSRNFVSETGRFRVQISVWLLWKGQSTILALFRRRILGKYPVAPCSPGPFVLLLTHKEKHINKMFTGLSRDIGGGFCLCVFLPHKE